MDSHSPWHKLAHVADSVIYRNNTLVDRDNVIITE